VPKTAERYRELAELQIIPHLAYACPPPSYTHPVQHAERRWKIGTGIGTGKLGTGRHRSVFVSPADGVALGGHRREGGHWLRLTQAREISAGHGLTKTATPREPIGLRQQHAPDATLPTLWRDGWQWQVRDTTIAILAVPRDKLANLGLGKRATFDKGPQIVAAKRGEPLKDVKPYTAEVRRDIDWELAERGVDVQR
jgi:hypothetical protein